MKKPRCDAQHEQPRLGAESHYAIQQGRSCDFGWDEASSGESRAEVVADEIIERWGGREITPALALEIAVRFSRASDGCDVAAMVDHAILFEMMRTMLERITSAKSAGLEAACQQVALGLRDSNNDSMRRVAAHYGVTVNAVSKRVREIAEVCDLPRTTFNKSAAAAAGYKLTNGMRKKL